MRHLKLIPLLSLLVVGMIFFGCGNKYTYTPSQLEELDRRTRLIELKYETRSGIQSAFYSPPYSPGGTLPDKVVIVYPGINSVALDWLRVIDGYGVAQTAYLVMDYPGRGNSEGRMRPKYLNDSVSGAIDSLSAILNITTSELKSRLYLLGHSFGCGAALQYASQVHVKHIILLAPFTTLHKIAFMRMGPIAWLIPDRIDNLGYLKEMHEGTPRPGVTIFHGEQDAVIPVKMGRQLAGLFPGWIVYHETQADDHMSVIDSSRGTIVDILNKN